jgi:hypothetical protein
MRFLITSVYMFFFASCISPPDYSDIPTLEFRSFSKLTMNQGVFEEDSVILTMFFTDGDGDFGISGQGLEKNIFIKDKRTNETFREYKAPFIPLEGAGNGISGTISIKLYSTCCIFPESSGIFPCEKSEEFPANDLELDVYIKDRAGNQSNVITTSKIKLNCN